MKGKLYSVALPIGNSKDITLRAREILSSIDIIACENTGKLKDILRRCDINTTARFMQYHSVNEKDSAAGLISLMESGKSIALVTDAGTPRLSDPGYHLIRGAFEANIEVSPAPGASALTAAMSIAPLPVDPMLFLGFISPKSGRRENLLKSYSSFEGTICFYESVHRIEKLLLSIQKTWGSVETFIARELTKQHENLYWGSIEDALVWVKDKKGEFIVMVHKKD